MIRRGPALIGSTLLVLSFIVVEALNTQGFSRGFPAALFATMWLLAYAFITLLQPVVEPATRSSSRSRLLFRLCALAIIGSMLVYATMDQMPCFLGVPNCD